MTTYFLCISCYLPVHSQTVQISVQQWPPPGTVTKDTIYYGAARPLKWSDFTGNIRQNSPSAALSFTGFSYDATTLTKNDTAHVLVYLQIYFVRSGSWFRPEDANAYTLSHEQIHFDIARLAAEIFRDSLLATPFSYQYYGTEINFLFLNCWRKMNQLQSDFDDQTLHGTNRAIEALWEKKISAKLPSDSDQGLPHDESPHPRR